MIRTAIVNTLAKHKVWQGSVPVYRAALSSAPLVLAGLIAIALPVSAQPYTVQTVAPPTPAQVVPPAPPTPPSTPQVKAKAKAAPVSTSSAGVSASAAPSSTSRPAARSPQNAGAQNGGGQNTGTQNTGTQNTGAARPPASNGGLNNLNISAPAAGTGRKNGTVTDEPGSFAASGPYASQSLINQVTGKVKQRDLPKAPISFGGVGSGDQNIGPAWAR